MEWIVEARSDIPWCEPQAIRGLCAPIWYFGEPPPESVA